MKREELKKFVNEKIETEKRLLEIKNKQYASENNCLDSLYKGAELNGMTVLTYVITLFTKHEMALRKIIENPNLIDCSKIVPTIGLKEDVEFLPKCISNMRNYLLLLEAIFRDCLT